VDGIVTELHVYPVKSCGGVALEEAVVGPFGLCGDREWQLVGDDGAPMTQRQFPVLARVRPSPVEGGLRLEAPGLPAIEVRTPLTADVTCQSFLGIEVRLGDAGDDAADWFGEVTGQPTRLLGIAEGYRRRLPDGVDVMGQDLSLADVAPLHLVNRDSFGALLAEAEEPFDTARFRANVVVDTGAPWVEDRWRTVRMGAVELTSMLPWPRCPIPQLDQRTGERHREPARVLRRLRWCADAADLVDVPEVATMILAGNALFGLGCAAGPVGARVRVGDTLEAVSTGPERLRC
jgi:uncharacterized protein YcbX